MQHRPGHPDPADVHTDVYADDFDGDALPLLYLTTETDPTRQWRLQTLQVVNWGSFHGHTTIDAGTLDTMLVGASGSGKSTIADAYSNLLNPSAAFNEASNTAVRGRARSADRRNEASYLRGQLGTDETDGVGAGRYLRDPKTWTWGGQAATFHDGKAHVALLRLFFVPAGKTRTSDVRGIYAIAERPVNLLDFQSSFSAAGIATTLRRSFPDVEFFTTQAEYCAAMDTKLSLGSARPLLARIQAGKTFGDVDTLFKDTVLDTPSTYNKAETGLAGFAHMSSVYDDLVNVVRQTNTLKGLDKDAEEYTAALAEHRTLTELGNPRAKDGPVALWQTRALADLLDVWEPRCVTDVAAARQRHNEAQAAAERAASTHLRLHTDARTKGADAVDQLDEQLGRRRESRDARQANRDRLAPHVRPLGPPPDTAEEFNDLTATAQELRHGQADARRPLKAAVEEANAHVWSLNERRREVEKDLEHATSREDLIPRNLDLPRAAMARAAGLDPADLPFAAELFDLHPDQEQWRRAVEMTLGALARTLLVDAEHLHAFSRAVDDLTDPSFARRRLDFIGVPTYLTPAEPTEPEFISGKVVYKDDSPFTGWLSHQLREHDHRCVQSAADLNGPGARVTLAGQTRRKNRGAHGGFDRPAMIGFSNTNRVAQLRTELANLAVELEQAVEVKQEAQGALDAFEARIRAAEEVLRWTFAELDVTADVTEITRLEGKIAELTTAGSPLALLLDEVERAKEAAHELAEAETLAKQGLSTAAQRHARIVEDKDDAYDTARRLEAAGVELTDEHTGLLERAFRVTDATTPEEWPQILAGGLERLRDWAGSAQRRLTTLTEKLEAMFARYDEQWEDRERTTTVASLPDYLRIFENLQNSGLAENMERFSRLMNDWAGQDLLPLHHAIDSEIAAIGQRLDPISDVLRRFPFGDQDHYLQLVSTRIVDADFTAWRQKMKDVISAGTAKMDWKDVQARYRQVQEVVAPLRHPRDGGSDAVRDRYLDINRRVRITAEEFASSDTRIGTIGNLAHFSGGESQELSAVIQVAALRYALGDSERARPRFGVIMMDEAFIKADKQFTQRSMTTLQNLGFQTVVAGPQQSMTAVGDFVERFAFVTKDRDSRISGVHMAFAEKVRQPAASAVRETVPAGSAPDLKSVEGG